jgi:hypothetical protein
MEAHSHLKSARLGFSPLRVAYALSFLSIGSVSADFLAEWRIAEWIGLISLALLAVVTAFCFTVPRGTPRRFLPVLPAALGVAGHMICMPL